MTEKSKKKPGVEVPPPGSVESTAKSRVVSDFLKADREAVALKRAAEEPLSETAGGYVEKFPDEIQDTLDAEDCLAILRGMAENDPCRKISRMYFRNNSPLKESTWNHLFGTFQEFVRQAKIKLSRHVHRHEKAIAKHVSVDHYRSTSGERRNYGDRYTVPSSDRFQTILVGSDFHDIHCDPFALRVFLDVARRASGVIKTVCINGDLFDLPEFGRYTQDPRTWDVVGRIQYVHNNILAPLREVLPDAQIDLIEGNHEARTLRHLSDATPAMKAVLADLHGFTISKLFGLDKYCINYVGKSDLSAWTEREFKSELSRNFRIYHGCLLAHHFIEGKAKGLPGWHGHSHKHLSWSHDSPIFGPYEWHQLGAMHVRRASYTDGERWTNGFMLAHVDTHNKRSCFEYIPVADFAWAGGVLYERTDEERSLPGVPKG